MSFTTSMTAVPSNPMEHSNMNYGPAGQSCVNISLDNGVFPSTTFEVVFSFQNRMSLNLIDPMGNVVFHFNPRLDEHHTVVNTKLGGFWGPEFIPTGMPFTAGVNYHVLVAYENEGYRIYVDGDEYTFFSHRSPIVPIRLEIDNAIVYRAIYSHGMPKWAARSFAPNFNVSNFTPQGVEVPFVQSLQHPFSIGSSITVVGFARNGADRIAINLIGNNNEDIIFHFNIRFNEGCIVRNTKCGSWGAEERDGGLPLQSGKKFTVSIVCEFSGFRTYVNGEQFVFYNHRGPFNDIRAVEVENDMKLFKIVQS